MEICGLYGDDINTDSDTYVKMIDFKNGKKEKEGCYHRDCFNDKLTGKSGKIKFFHNFMNKGMRVLDKADKRLNGE